MLQDLSGFGSNRQLAGGKIFSDGIEFHPCMVTPIFIGLAIVLLKRPVFRATQVNPCMNMATSNGWQVLMPFFHGGQWKLSHPWSICTALHFFLVGGRVHGNYLVKRSRLRCPRTRQFRPTGSTTFSMEVILVRGANPHVKSSVHDENSHQKVLVLNWFLKSAFSKGAPLRGIIVQLKVHCDQAEIPHTIPKNHGFGDPLKMQFTFSSGCFGTGW